MALRVGSRSRGWSRAIHSYRGGKDDSVRRTSSSDDMNMGPMEVQNLMDKDDHHKYRPKRVILIRHGQSLGNIDESVYTHTPDWQIPLSPLGIEQSRDCGRRLRELVKDNPCLFYISPYRRTVQTFEEIAKELDKKQVVGWQQDPRAVEQQFGNLQKKEDIDRCKEERQEFGRFFYRFKDGESGLDVYHRMASLITTMFNDVHHMRDSGSLSPDLNIVLVTHGLTLRTFVMRWFKLSVDEFEEVWNPPNASMIIMERCEDESGRQWFEMGQQAWELMKVSDPSRFMVHMPGGGSRPVFHTDTNNTKTKDNDG